MRQFTKRLQLLGTSSRSPDPLARHRPLWKS